MAMSKLSAILKKRIKDEARLSERQELIAGLCPWPAGWLCSWLRVDLGKLLKYKEILTHLLFKNCAF